MSLRTKLSCNISIFFCIFTWPHHTNNYLKKFQLHNTVISAKCIIKILKFTPNLFFFFSFFFSQLFILYDSLVEPSLKEINSITSSAVNMCTCAYLLVSYIICNYKYQLIGVDLCTNVYVVFSLLKFLIHF